VAGFALTRLRIRSRRRRRRLAKLVIVLVVAGSVAAIVAIVGNTGKKLDSASRNGTPQFYKTPAVHHLSASEVKNIRAVSVVFIGSAVARQRLDDSYRIVTDSLREGLTRTQWRSGSIPVIPFDVGSIMHFSLDWSYENDVAYDVSLAAKPGAFPRAKTFLIELKRNPKLHRWLVDSWSPVGISTDTPEAAAAARGGPPPDKALSTIWLLVPASILVILALTPIVIFTKHWYENRRARRALMRG
jgi:hypothetical protein